MKNILYSKPKKLVGTGLDDCVEWNIINIIESPPHHQNRMGQNFKRIRHNRLKCVYNIYIVFALCEYIFVYTRNVRVHFPRQLQLPSNNTTCQRRQSTYTNIHIYTQKKLCARMSFSSYSQTIRCSQRLCQQTNVFV